MTSASLQHRDVPIVFNLFPRYFPTIDDWAPAAIHAGNMGFNWIYVNPFHLTGYSGSLYAIKNYYQINPLFLKQGQDLSDWRPLKKFIAACTNAGCNVMMDLVINHTAFDSNLVKTNPLWYKRGPDGKLWCPRAIDPANAENVTIWGDLAEIDNRDSRDKKGLYDYWDKLIAYFQTMGISGFRCDAAYQVPADLWTLLISSAKKRFPRTVFLAETLGCRLEEIDQLFKTGFDYLYNSSKYWNFDQPWCIEQHEHNKRVAPSVSFPESHDTVRLASEDPGTINVQKSRYLFSAVFSAGVLIPMGYEYGAKIKTDVVKGSIKDVEQPQWDLTKWIAGVNALKKRTAVFCEEGTWKVLSSYDHDVLFMEKWTEDEKESVLVCVNKNKYSARHVSSEECPREMEPYSSVMLPFSEAFSTDKKSSSFELDPAGIALFFK